MVMVMTGPDYATLRMLSAAARRERKLVINVASAPEEAKRLAALEREGCATSWQRGRGWIEYRITVKGERQAML
jgi:hypothetical protein